MPLKPRGAVTYSPAFTLVPTNECFNRCTYCNFRRDLDAADWLSLGSAKRQLQNLQGSGVCEILILSGEVHPLSSRRKDWLAHIKALCELVLAEGFLPHSNVGPLSYPEMESLGQVNVSMGLMLEQHNLELQKTVHFKAPSKEPNLRLQQLHWAGELQIPFTTGLLFGIGESQRDWSVGLEAIAQAQETWGHIQEVILQPYQPGSWEYQPRTPFSEDLLVTAVELARSILPKSITIQIPPNLLRTDQTLRTCLENGATDLGGIVPHDFVNPDYSHREFALMKVQLAGWGYEMEPRLPIYPNQISKLSQNLQTAIWPWLSGEKMIGYNPPRSQNPKSINLLGKKL
jgi:7,8-didemethyl-8-hydroxy-5-deazariboflavin synthase